MSGDESGMMGIDEMLALCDSDDDGEFHSQPKEKAPASYEAPKRAVLIPTPQPALVAAVDADLESAMLATAAMHDDEEDNDSDGDGDGDDSDDEAAIRAQMEALQRKLAQKKQKKGKKRLSEGGGSTARAPPSRPISSSAQAASSFAGRIAAAAHADKKRRLVPKTKPASASAPSSARGAGEARGAREGGAGGGGGGGAASSAAIVARVAADANAKAATAATVARGLTGPRLTNRINNAAAAVPSSSSSSSSSSSASRTEPALPLRKTANKRSSGTSSASASASSSATSGAGLPADTTDHVEVFSGLSVKNRIVSSGEFKRRMEGRRFVKMAELCKLLSKGKTEVHAESDWVTAGVLIKKSVTKKTKTDKNFAVWTLSDLNGSEMSMFLFSPAFGTHWKEMEGTIVALLNPEVMPPNGRSNDTSSLSMDNPQLLMKIGACPDFGTCKGITKAGARCTISVNKKKGDFCEYHVQAEYKKAKGKRQIMNNSSNSTTNRKPLQLQSGRSKIRGHLSSTHGVVRVPQSSSSTAPVSRGAAKMAKANGSRVAPDAQGIKAKLTEELWDRTSGNSQFKRTLVAMEAEKQAKADARALKAAELKQKQQKQQQPGSTKNTTIFGEKTTQVAKTFNAQFYEEATGRYSSGKVEHTITGAAAKLLNCAPGRSFTAPKGPTLGRGFSGGGSITLSSGNASAEEKAAAIFKAKGGIKKRNPNAAETSMKKYASIEGKTAGGSVNLQRVAAPNAQQVRHGMQHGGPGGPGRIKVGRNALGGGMAGVPGGAKRSMMKPAAKGSMADAMGLRVDLESEAGKALLQKKSLNVKAMEEEQFEQLERKLDQISKIEKMETKMSEINDKQVTCFKCEECKQLYRRKEQFCIGKGHHLSKVKARVRFWKCKHCAWQSQTLGERRPTKACKCGKADYEKGSMLRTKGYSKDPNKLELGWID